MKCSIYEMLVPFHAVTKRQERKKLGKNFVGKCQLKNNGVGKKQEKFFGRKMVEKNSVAKLQENFPRRKILEKICWLENDRKNFMEQNGSYNLMVEKGQEK